MTETSFSGRIALDPDALVHTAVLKPQFDYEVAHLLPFYLALEKVSVDEACTLGLLPPASAQAITGALDRIDATALQASPGGNMSDISFAIEQLVASQVDQPLSTWHIDKSRNDFQASAQRMFGRKRLFGTVALLLRLHAATLDRAEQTLDMPMPGHTHYQAAQIISPAFYLAAVGDALLSAARRLLVTYDELNLCPLGAGAMAGLEFAWDRRRMAARLGFSGPVRSALGSVADRDWVLKISFEYAALGTAISRFCTDLSTWGSGEHGYIDLPDSMVGISSAMPQKRNLTILERIRGETAHLDSLHVDFLFAQRNTPFTNLVEVSKEGGRYVAQLFDHAERIIALLHLVMRNLIFCRERMRAGCEAQYFGGFALANALTLHHHIPYRKAQVIAGELIRDAIRRGAPPSQIAAAALSSIAQQHGYTVDMDQHQLQTLFDVDANLRSKHTEGSTHPDQVLAALQAQRAEHTQLEAAWGEREGRVRAALEALGCRA